MPGGHDGVKRGHRRANPLWVLAGRLVALEFVDQASAHLRAIKLPAASIVRTPDLTPWTFRCLAWIVVQQEDVNERLATLASSEAASRNLSTWAAHGASAAKSETRLLNTLLRGIVAGLRPAPADCFQLLEDVIRERFPVRAELPLDVLEDSPARLRGFDPAEWSAAEDTDCGREGHLIPLQFNQSLTRSRASTGFVGQLRDRAVVTAALTLRSNERSVGRRAWSPELALLPWPPRDRGESHLDHVTCDRGNECEEPWDLDWWGQPAEAFARFVITAAGDDSSVRLVHFPAYAALELHRPGNSLFAAVRLLMDRSSVSVDLAVARIPEEDVEARALLDHWRRQPVDAVVGFAEGADRQRRRSMNLALHALLAGVDHVAV